MTRRTVSRTRPQGVIANGELPGDRTDATTAPVHELVRLLPTRPRA